MAEWLWQPRAVKATHDSVARGQRRIVLAMPTGMGKTRTGGMIVSDYLEEMQRAVFYASRRQLINQTSRAMDDVGIIHGVRMAGITAESHHPFQLSSVQTEVERLATNPNWALHRANLVIFDEGHLHTGGSSKEFAELHRDEHDAVVLYLTATPFGLQEVADELIIGATKEEGRKAGALVPAIMYGPDEPDPATIGLDSLEDDFNEVDCTKAMGAVNAKGKANERLKTLFGRIGENFDILNPDRKPTMLFAPGVKESMWCVDRFRERGVAAAHIDADYIYYGQRDSDGLPITIPSSDENRNELREQSKEGYVKVVSSRFLMREGVDWPWIEHLILATIFGSYQTYIQSVGRGLRASPGKSRCIIQDHGGHSWRYPSPNADYPWRLDLTNRMATSAHYDDLREGRVKQPYCCPNCRMILRTPKCPCGRAIDPRFATRPIITSQGILKEFAGPALEPRRRVHVAGAAALWARCFFRIRNSKRNMTAAQAEGLFVREFKFWPERNLPYMPIHSFDWFRPAKDIPMDRLIPKG